MSILLDLSGKVAFITGAGQGVGRQIGVFMAEHGAKTVIINDIVAERAEEVAAEINKIGSQGIAAPADITDWENVKKLAGDAKKDFGGVDILVNNAGNAGTSTPEALASRDAFLDTNPEDWEKWIRINYYSPMLTCRAFGPSMKEKGYGRIINIISDAGRVGEPFALVVYSGAKAGTAGFTRGLAKEMGRYNVTANCVALGATNTPAIAMMVEATKADPALAKKALSRYVIKRYGEPSDPAALVLFLASDAAGWITGQTFPVNGGYSMTM